MSEERYERRPVVEPVAYRVDDAAEALGISRSAIYELIRSNQLRTIKHGSRRLVPVSCLHEFIAAALGDSA